jgi:hypothetical protein
MPHPAWEVVLPALAITVTVIIAIRAAAWRAQEWRAKTDSAIATMSAEITSLKRAVLDMGGRDEMDDFRNRVHHIEIQMAEAETTLNHMATDLLKVYGAVQRVEDILIRRRSEGRE